MGAFGRSRTVLCVGYLLLVRPIVGQLGGIELTEVTSDPAPDPHKLAPIYVFASAEQVLPWLGQHAQTTGVLLREVTQWPDQLGLTIRLDFPRRGAGSAALSWL